MRAGKLDRLITIQRKTETVSPRGGVTETWVNIVHRRPASMMPVRGEERFTGDQIVGQEQVEFRVRYSQDIAALTPRDRVIHPALSDESPSDDPEERRLYNVLAVHEIGRREGLRIITQRRADAAT